jgi:glycosyltransferase involved in cell wall biosynthesis
MKPRKVLHVFPYYIPPRATNANGVKRVLLSLLAGLDRSRFEPILVCPAPSPFDRDFAEVGVQPLYVGDPQHLILLRSRNPLALASYVPRFLKYRSCFIKLIKATQPVLVHSHVSAFLGAAAAARSLGVPSVIHIHEAGVRLPPWMYRLYNRAVMHWADHLILVASFLLPHFSTMARRGRVTVINGGIDGTRFSPSPEHGSCRAQWGIKPHELVLGFLGRLSPRKGAEYAIEAFSRIRQRVPHARLVIVGDIDSDRERWYREALLGRVRRLGLGESVVFPGHAVDVRPTLQSFDIQLFVSPQDDALGMVIVEGMAMARPIVAASSGGVSDIIVSDRNGVLLAPRDVEGLASAVVRLALDPSLRKRMGEAARQTVVEKLNLAKFSASVESVYETMLTGTAP